MINKYNFETRLKTGIPHKWRISIWKEYLPRLVELVEHHFIAEIKYKINI